MKNPNWSSKEDDIIKTFYTQPNGSAEIQKLLPYRNYNGIKARANLLGITRRIDYVQDDSFFTIPNEINCAIAGFIAADGCVSDSGRLTITLANKDHEYLASIRALTQYSGKIHNVPPRSAQSIKIRGKIHTIVGGGSKSMQIQCRRWADDLLKNWNITPRKTYTLMPPNLTTFRHKMAYISGEIDGDGWIVASNYLPARNGRNYAITLMGTKALMDWVKSVFDEIVPNCNASQLLPTVSDGIYVYKIVGAKAYWIAKLCLALDILRLERKWKNVRELIDVTENQKDVSKKMRYALIHTCPSDDVLREFGLLEHKKTLFEMLLSLKIEPKRKHSAFSV